LFLPLLFARISTIKGAPSISQQYREMGGIALPSTHHTRCHPEQTKLFCHPERSRPRIAQPASEVPAVVLVFAFRPHQHHQGCPIHFTAVS
jgi:hypothetical protein